MAEQNFTGPVVPEWMQQETQTVSYQNSPSSGGNGSNLISSILGNGGLGGAFSGAGDLLCSIKGNCQPKVVNYNQGTGFGMGNILMPLLLIAVVGVVLFFLLKK